MANQQYDVSVNAVSLRMLASLTIGSSRSSARISLRNTLRNDSGFRATRTCSVISS